MTTKPKNKKFTLTPDQVTGVKIAIQAYKKYRGVLNADIMGYGKTAQAIDLIKKAMRGEGSKVVVIVPAYLVYNWLYEFKLWGVNTSKLCVIDRGSQRLPKDCNIYTGSYNLMTSKKIWAQMMKMKFTFLVCDEAHYLRSWNSTRARRILGNGSNPNNNYFKKSDKTMLLTGTPVMNRIEEFYNLIHRIAPKVLPMARDEFIQRYAGEIWPTPWGMKYKGIKNAKELVKRIQPVFIRRDKIEGLPSRVDRNIPLEIKGAALKKFIKEENHFLSKYNITEKNIEERQELSKEDKERISKVRQEVAVLKIPMALNFIADTLEKTDKIILYVFHREVQRILAEEIKKKFGCKKTLEIINGSVSMKKRQLIIDAYQAGKINILLNTVGALREGANLTAGNHVLFLEYDWTPEGMEQAIARLHRKGQKETVFVYYLFFDGGIDKYIADLLKEKRNIIKKVIKGE